MGRVCLNSLLLLNMYLQLFVVVVVVVVVVFKHLQMSGTAFLSNDLTSLE